MKMYTIPAGITWKQEGAPSRWVCTIRREPETIFEWEPRDYAAVQQTTLGGLGLGLRNAANVAALGGLRGGLGL